MNYSFIRLHIQLYFERMYLRGRMEAGLYWNNIIQSPAYARNHNNGIKFPKYSVHCGDLTALVNVRSKKLPAN